MWCEFVLHLLDEINVLTYYILPYMNLFNYEFFWRYKLVKFEGCYRGTIHCLLQFAILEMLLIRFRTDEKGREVKGLDEIEERDR